MAEIKITDSDRERFYFHIITKILTPEVCWEMDTAHSYDNYPSFWMDGTSRRACRISYLLFYNIDPKELQIRHKCHNRKCVNPYHLKLGTVQDNLKDRDQANRQAKGSKVGTSVLTEQNIVELLIDIWNYKYTAVIQVARKYNVSNSTINEILQGKRWTHVTNQLQVSLKELKNRVINQKSQLGENSIKAKFNRDQVLEIIALLKQNISNSEIARKFNVTPTTISCIKLGKTYTNITFDFI